LGLKITPIFNRALKTRSIFLLNFDLNIAHENLFYQLDYFSLVICELLKPLQTLWLQDTCQNSCWRHRFVLIGHYAFLN